MKGRHPASVDDAVPGPGHYNQPPDSEPHQWTFSHGSRDLKLGKRDVPGPGNYDPTLGVASPEWRFGGEGRERREPRDEPGPGAYDLPDIKDKVAFSLSSRHGVSDKEERPGPGAYDPALYSSAPRFSLGSAARSQAIQPSALPGPGQYDSHPQTAPSSKYFSHRFGTGQRVNLHPAAETPGPGAYQHLPKTAGPQFTFKGRYYNSVGEEVPGPGQYNQEIPRQVAEPSPAYNFGTERRDRAVVDTRKLAEGVGPGMYHTELRKAPPYWSFGGQKRSKGEKLGPPGPGQYDVPDTIAVVPPYSVPYGEPR